MTNEDGNERNMMKPSLSPERLRATRDMVLKYIYENGAHMPHHMVIIQDVLDHFSLDHSEFSEIWAVLYNQGLLDNQAFGGWIGINTLGMSEAERLGPAVPMRDPPAPNSVTINNSGYGIVQVAGSHSNQTATVTVEQSAILNLLSEIEQALPNLQLQPLQKDEARGLLAGLRQTLQSKASPAVSRAIGASLSGLLRSAGSDLGHRLMEMLGITST